MTRALTLLLAALALFPLPARGEEKAPSATPTPASTSTPTSISTTTTTTTTTTTPTSTATTTTTPTSTATSPPAPRPDVWAPLRPLLGVWEGTVSGKPGEGTVRREYRLVLRDRFIEVRNTSTYPPQEKNPKGEVHEDVGYISWDRARKLFVLRQFHVEGFVNTYAAPPPADGAPLVFTSESIENIPPGWRARETYHLGADALAETFELGGPGRELAPYSASTFRRAGKP